MTADPKRAQAVFLAAAELSSPAERAALLDRECGADADLRRRVEVLLRAHDAPDSMIDRPFVDLAPLSTSVPAPTAPASGGAAPNQAGATADLAHENGLGHSCAPTVAHPASGSRPPAEGPGCRIGPYTLLRVIGEGGTGVVYEAEQSAPVRRAVALKVIKPGTDTAAVLARFDAERQALALMYQPHIAKVLDAGATGDAGRMKDEQDAGNCLS